MGGRLTEEGVEIKCDFDAILRAIDLAEALRDIFEVHEDFVKASYEQAIEYIAGRIRVALGLYDEGEQPEPESEG